MVVNERNIRHQLVLEAAHRMMVAARTAPKGKGIDIVEVGMAIDENIERLSAEMIRISGETGMKFFLRDAENIKSAEAILLVGTRQQVQGLNCAPCGFATCAEKPEAVPCAINAIDLGIAIGSACATAADLRVDTRVMFSAGLAAQHLHYLGEESKCVMAIPVSASSKNPFFDRKPKENK